MTTNGVRPVRTLPPAPSVAQVERAMYLLASEALKIGAVYREAQEIAYATDNGDNTKVSGGSIKPTEDTVMAGLVNGDDEADRWNRDREGLRVAVNALATSLQQMGLAQGRLKSIVRTHQRSGNAVDMHGKAASQTWVAAEAERLATEFEHRPVPRESTDRRHWPRRRG